MIDFLGVSLGHALTGRSECEFIYCCGFDLLQVKRLSEGLGLLILVLGVSLLLVDFYFVSCNFLLLVLIAANLFEHVEGLKFAFVLYFTHSAQEISTRFMLCF